MRGKRGQERGNGSELRWKRGQERGNGSEVRWKRRAGEREW